MKTKIPILITIMLLLNTVILFLYYNFYFYNVIADKIEKISGVKISREILKENRIVLDLIRFEVITICLLLLLTGVVIYIIYSRPLAKLNASVKGYRENAIGRTKRGDEIGQIQNTFARITEELQEEKQAQNRIIASISHDIKTPLTSVLGYSESLLKKKELPEERVKQYLKVVHDKALDIEEIVQDFDNYIEGKLATTLNVQPCKLAFIEEMLVQEYKKELEQKKICFEVVNNTSSLQEISLDLAKLRRVFANLIGNAIRHNEKKEGLRITVTISNDGEKVSFTVRDNGSGIPEKDQPYVFEPFYTRDNSRAVSGLGLSIARSIIEAHSGKIWVDGIVKDGCCIRFYLK
jgi:signal transduction histidine kinase